MSTRAIMLLCEDKRNEEGKGPRDACFLRGSIAE